MVQLKIKKPRAILFDIQGTAAKNSFGDKVLLPYFRTHTRFYLEENWGSPQVEEDIERLRTHPVDPGAPVVPPKDAPKEEIIQAVSDLANYCCDHKIEKTPISLLRFHVWFDGYDRNKIETPVYSDVAIQIQKWRCDQNIRLYVFSNGWSEATRRFLSRTNQGDLNLLIDGHFDTTFGSLTDQQTHLQVLAAIKLKPEEVLFLTKSPAEAKTACKVHIPSVLVLTHRTAIDKLDDEEKAIPRIRSFNELEFEA